MGSFFFPLLFAFYLDSLYSPYAFSKSLRGERKKKERRINAFSSHSYDNRWPNELSYKCLGHFKRQRQIFKMRGLHVCPLHKRKGKREREISSSSIFHTTFLNLQGAAWLLAQVIAIAVIFVTSGALHCLIAITVVKVCSQKFNHLHTVHLQ